MKRQKMRVGIVVVVVVAAASVVVVENEAEVYHSEETYVRVCVRSCTRSKIYVHIIKCAMILIFYRFFHFFVNKSEIFVYKSVLIPFKNTHNKNYIYFLNNILYNIN